MITPEQIFKENYGHAFDVDKSFEAAFIECSKGVAKIYALEVLKEFAIKFNNEYKGGDVFNLISKCIAETRGKIKKS